ncbi:3-hydroxyacyl-ACP dehydratase FabZ [bacterium]|jgi:beta-hydroxyacyl-ACP dehydratase FabZ|nr:3-hydroxyacyl-ACP dehydratase FabZ [bacterium]
MDDNRYRLNIDQVRKYLPHRAPFLMVDRVLEIHPSGDVKSLVFDQTKNGTKVVTIKNVTYNEPYFVGHFPAFSIMPGVMIVEALAQTSSFSIYPYVEHYDVEVIARDFQCILVGVDNLRLRRPVTPGDTLRLETVVTKCRGKLWQFEAVAMVDGQKVAECEIMANLILKTEGIVTQ